MCGAPGHGLLREEPLWVEETEKDFSTKEAHGIRSDRKCLKSKQTTHDEQASTFHKCESKNKRRFQSPSKCLPL
jgi:hypothetical protein